MLAEKFPLQWPHGYPRIKNRNHSRFGRVSFAVARDKIFHELRLMLSHGEKSSVVLSTNIPLKMDGLPYATFKQPDDPGIAVYFLYQGESMVICCDKWKLIEHNMWAVAKTIEAMRGIERWGVSDFLKRSFTGFIALPPKRDLDNWWVVLGYDMMPGKEVWNFVGAREMYRSLVKKRHPDSGGSDEEFQKLQNAYNEAKKYFGVI